MITPEAVETSATAAIIVSELMEVLKNSNFLTFINAKSDKVNRVVGLSLAFLTGLGIHFNFDAQTGQLVVSGLFASSVVHGLLQWAQQQAYFRMLVQKKGTLQ